MKAMPRQPSASVGLRGWGGVVEVEVEGDVLGVGVLGGEGGEGGGGWVG